MWGQTCGSGQPVELRLGGPRVTGLAQSPWSSDLASRSFGPDPAGLEARPSCSGSSGPLLIGLSFSGPLPRKDLGWAKAKEPLVVTGLERRGPRLPGAKGLAPSSEARPLAWTGPCLLKGPDAGISFFWLKDDLSKQVEEEPCSVENLKTNGALLEEALRYGTAYSPFGLLVPIPSSIFGRTPLGEYYDFSGAGWELAQRETQCCIVNGPGSTEQRAVTSWELMEVNNGNNGECGEELCLVRIVPQEARGWEEVNWEDSELARFNKFLGFSTKGWEKDILDLLVKIRRRRERVHSKVLLDKSKFERELKRLEYSINYEGGKKQKSGTQERGGQMLEV